MRWVGKKDGANNDSGTEEMFIRWGGEDWDELLPYVAMGYRMSKQKSLGYSPYFLMFGRDPIL